jgi:hypothetical protein
MTTLCQETSNARVPVSGHGFLLAIWYLPPHAFLRRKISRKSERALDSKCETYFSNLRCLANLKARLDEAGASFSDIVKLNYYVTDATNIQNLRDVRDSYVNREYPPASTLVVVKQLFREELLIEVDAIAVVKD